MSTLTGPVIGAEFRGVARQMRDLRRSRISFLLGMQAMFGTGAPDPPALHNGGPPTRSRHMPGHQLPGRSAAKDQLKLGIGRRLTARWKDCFDKMAGTGLVNPRTNYKRAYTL